MSSCFGVEKQKRIFLTHHKRQKVSLKHLKNLSAPHIEGLFLFIFENRKKKIRIFQIFYVSLQPNNQFV